jgi:S-adenosylmethionine:tRNA ribosyltransferase-isomerase
MLLSEYTFDLPEHLIAQQPLENREDSRMLFVDRSSASFANQQFTDFADFLRKDDVVVLNNTKVFPARLLGKSETGASIEIFLIEEISPMTWLTLARPAKRLKVGKKIFFEGTLTCEIKEKTADGKVVVHFAAIETLETVLQEIGRTPLPPYIKRNEAGIDADRERYQTVYASKSGAIAAPTAGLHFTPKVLDQIKNIGATIAEITLHVGYGTFEPIRVTELSKHKVAPERYEISDDTAKLLNNAKSEGRRIIAIGTTTTRALESSMANHGQFVAGHHSADLTITPGYEFRAVDGLLTNFHLPQSSLLVLVSTFGGHELIMDAYRHAVSARYRFYSYGDCMFIV